MDQLNIVNRSGTFVADSREIAEMINVRHSDLLERIGGYIKHLTSGNFRSSDFFIQSFYNDAKNEKRPNYLVTRKGCDMVANKMTGKKGVLFTATYVSRFEEMERQLVSGHKLPQNYKEALVALVEQVEVNEQLETRNLLLEQRVSEYEPKITYLDRILSSKGTMTITQIAKDYDLTGPQLNKILHEEGVQYKQNGQWLLYAKHTSKGYTKSETINITRSNGEPDTRLYTRWSQSGRLFIHEILAKRGIIPFMDRANIGA